MFLVRRETHSCPTRNTPQHVRTESLILADSGTQCLGRLVVSSTQPGGDQPFVQKNIPGQDIYRGAHHVFYDPLMPHFIRRPHDCISQRPLTGDFIIVLSIVSPPRLAPSCRAQPSSAASTNQLSCCSRLLLPCLSAPPYVHRSPARRTCRGRRPSSCHGGYCGPSPPVAHPVDLVRRRRATHLPQQPPPIPNLHWRFHNVASYVAEPGGDQGRVIEKLLIMVNGLRFALWRQWQHPKDTHVETGSSMNWPRHPWWGVSPISFHTCAHAKSLPMHNLGRVKIMHEQAFFMLTHIEGGDISQLGDPLLHFFDWIDEHMVMDSSGEPAFIIRGVPIFGF